MLVPHCPLRSMIKSSEVGRCAMHASVRRSIALQSSSALFSRPSTSVTCRHSYIIQYSIHNMIGLSDLC